MPKIADFGDIATKVKTYEDAARYFAEYKNRCYEDEIADGTMKPFEPLEPEKLTKEACSMTLSRDFGKDYKDPDHELIRAINDRLDLAEERLEALEDELT
ncbi:MAG: hypothetical protein J5685_07370 [Clostridiales bacterium]|nr:hypothetical protein [Clostridiales bacterium]